MSNLCLTGLYKLFVQARINASGKLELLDKMMARLLAAGHRVLIYSQFTRTLDILEDWLLGRRWGYLRIDGGWLLLLLLGLPLLLVFLVLWLLATNSTSFAKLCMCCGIYMHMAS